MVNGNWMAFIQKMIPNVVSVAVSCLVMIMVLGEIRTPP